MVTDGSADAAATPRVILLGASNLTRGLATIIDVCESVWGQPLDFYAAIGHGRSFGNTACVCGRTLPGILQCDLWSTLDQAPPAPTAALISDVGNDIFYGVSPQQIVEWVDEAVTRLQKHNARVLLTRLPVDNVPLIKAWQFAVFRRLFFPFCSFTLDETAARVSEVDRLLVKLATARGVPIIEQQPAWYGFDPIHITRKQCRSAYQTILHGWNTRATFRQDCRPVSFSHWLYLQRLKPARQWILGREQLQAQPCARLRSGTTLHFY